MTGTAAPTLDLLAVDNRTVETPPRGYMPVAATTDWATPPDDFDRWDAEFGPFDLDPCGQREHHYTAYRIESRGGRCFDGSTLALDGLKQSWRNPDGSPSTVYVNPPYGGELPVWIAQMYAQIDAGNSRLVLGLLPARTDTRAWQQYILRSAERRATYVAIEAAAHVSVVRFLGRRIRFVGAPCARCARAKPKCRQAHAGEANTCRFCGCTKYIPTGAPFPSALVVWRSATVAQLEAMA